MPIVSTHKDLDALTLTFVAEFTAPASRVWQLWSDPRQLERWWGPPTWPATFERYDFVPGGSAHYFMTGPEGEQARAWWRFLTVNAPHSLSFEDGFSDDSGTPDLSMPIIRADVSLEQISDGTRMTVASTFADAGQFEQVSEMGMVEGMTAAMGQIDGLLREA